ncbi:hypothetical protein SPBR_05284 [Sporothrix brasiliensis 5110]|uniref:DUF7719 domain-containing protein n=1 Tax=Sporothrix brasiliensis 5110 TaxID=1398154 RepID=A0A0C2IEQ1_9PEZI|nr:uncharacterized protein SPBR_05284 [Sporothrix brasiliensis 5110]KIH87711.1 hypothetical protein SPBR_05284 [Sporothrix brasiliensis 5110]
MAKKTRKGVAAASSIADIDAAGIKLVQPDRSAPQGKTLLDFAGDQNLFQQADARQRQLNKERGVPKKAGEADSDNDDDDDDDEDEDENDNDAATVSPRAERILDTILWCVSLTMLHFTLDVLVQNQYAVEIEWHVVITRALQALGVFSLIFYNLHRHPSDPRLLPGLPTRFQDPLRQLLFFVTSSVTGCYLVHITNEYSYIAVLKQAPPIGCLWVWAVIELDLKWAVPSLAIAAGYMKLMGYTI